MNDKKNKKEYLEYIHKIDTFINKVKNKIDCSLKLKKKSQENKLEKEFAK